MRAMHRIVFLALALVAAPWPGAAQTAGIESAPAVAATPAVAAAAASLSTTEMEKLQRDG